MALYYDTLVEAPSEEVPPVVGDWLTERSSGPWLTVEIGHGRFPQAAHETFADDGITLG
jgi:hypothetical protein